MLDFGTFSDDCRLIRQKSPIIYNVTNYVAMNITANTLLAAGASPVMSSEPDEAEEIAAGCDALAVNIGCLEQLQIKTMRIAAAAMHRLGKPWVLDPVAAGMSRLRLDTALELIEQFHPSAVRCNASEIMALCGASALHHGVDSAEDSISAAGFADEFASSRRTVVSVSGAVDYITDGSRSVRIFNGSPVMPRVTAMGCTATALTAAFLSVCGDGFTAAAEAMAVMGIAGETAARRSSGPGSLAVNFIDSLASFDAGEAISKIRYE